MERWLDRDKGENYSSKRKRRSMNLETDAVSPCKLKKGKFQPQGEAIPGF